MLRPDFDQIVDRRNTASFKWDLVQRLYGDDVLPMWIADMDFITCPKIIEALNRRIEHGIFGYTFRGQEYYNAIADWYAKRYGVQIQPDWIVNGPGVVPMLSFLIEKLTQPGDKVIIQPPVYPPFFRVVENNGRRLVRNDLIRDVVDGKTVWKMDYEKLESLIDDRTKMLIISNPHNPVGRVWTFEELNMLYKIARKYDLVILSDEIHADIIYKPSKFTSFLAVGHEGVVVLNSPGKTFNIAGLTNSYAIIPDRTIRREYKNYMENLELLSGNILSLEALKAAYECDDWVDELLKYLEANRDFAYQYIKTNMPALVPSHPEGTYLMWIDCSELNVESPAKLFLEKGRVYLNDGADFGAPNCVRLNFACPKSVLREGLERMKMAYHSGFELRECSINDDEYWICREIRTQVFNREQGIPQELDFDEHERTARHFVLKFFSRPVATARTREIEPGIWKIERVAVKKQDRGKGFGKKLMNLVEEKLFSEGAKKLTLNAQIQVKDFYTKLGYNIIGAEFLEAGIPHVKCEKSKMEG
uniref:cysteine-S-conjugate beta-lyase n=1 Tax=Fervidobacterium thailandense TaxID=1008305 RepID=A0A7C5VL32_9BACT